MTTTEAMTARPICSIVVVAIPGDRYAAYVFDSDDDALTVWNRCQELELDAETLSWHGIERYPMGSAAVVLSDLERLLGVAGTA